jgi:hypothetical protein
VSICTRVLRQIASSNGPGNVIPDWYHVALSRLFVGPSYFRIRQEAVSNIIYTHEFLLLVPVHEVEIRRYETATIEYEDGGAWGFHVGGDVSIFFTRVVGLGWFVKYSRGTVEVFEPLSEVEVKFRTGGFQTGGGLRLRF